MLSQTCRKPVFEWHVCGDGSWHEARVAGFVFQIIYETHGRVRLLGLTPPMLFITEIPALELVVPYAEAYIRDFTKRRIHELRALTVELSE